MKLGILTDPHLGFARYSVMDEHGVNRREADFYAAFDAAVQNLLAAGAEAILDLGDLADAPHPKKRALRVLIETINATGLPWVSVGGNHTLVRRATDIHLYDLLSAYCPMFFGFTEPGYAEGIDALLVPYGNSDEIKAGLALAEKLEPSLIGGHWACEDVLPDGHDIALADLPDVPTVLGHFHGRSHPELPAKSLILGGHDPVYIGATERKAWGEATNPTGAAIYDADTSELTFIDHPARPWIDLVATHEDYMDALAVDLEGAIVRLTVEATPEQYKAVHEVEARRRAKGALDFTIRRARKADDRQQAAQVMDRLTLRPAWREHIAAAAIPRGVDRSEVQRIGDEALERVGVTA